MGPRAQVVAPAEQRARGTGLFLGPPAVAPVEVAAVGRVGEVAVVRAVKPVLVGRRFRRFCTSSFIRFSVQYNQLYKYFIRFSVQYNQLYKYFIRFSVQYNQLYKYFIRFSVQYNDLYKYLCCTIFCTV